MIDRRILFSSTVGAQAIKIPRSRFAPVKKCDDLLALRSDAYKLTEAFRVGDWVRLDGCVIERCCSLIGFRASHERLDDVV